jgi:hypothetical protein
MIIRRFTHRLLLPLICCFSLINAEIKEIKSMEEISDTIEILLKSEKKLFVVFDIDDTLATPEYELGKSSWFYQELSNQQAQPNADKQKVLNDLIALYTHVHNYLPLKAVEVNTPLLVTNLQSRGIPCIALTARSLLIKRTFEQLLPLGIDFTLCAPSTDNMILSDNPELPACYMQGIIFNGDNNKGVTLLKYLRAINFAPDHVIYVDDSIKQVQRVHDALEEASISCTGFRYNYMDEENKNFNLAEAQQQLAAFLKNHPFTQAAA